ncbi:nucleotide disphospho-sugar-binding domain-containing protein [Streptomyces sp. NPDC019224]|uniref:nucleotide disphospho-sugar-binding domain-containing protein n=1 Tax=Streptomyces sp. NPDC019224 TaxID=3154484 RepID=UPI0033DEE1C8
MRILFIAGASSATVFALAPLATAARQAGHEVIMAATQEMTPVITGVGLPAVPVTAKTIPDFLLRDRAGNPVPVPTTPAAQMHHTGGWFARMAVDSLPALDELSAAWHPDLVVGGTLSYAAPLLATRLGVPCVRHAWDAMEYAAMDAGAEDELAPELAAAGLTALPAPDLFIDISPPSVRPDHDLPIQPMRWTPGNAQRQLEPWMYTKGDRPRICLTSGSRVASGQEVDRNYTFLRAMVEEFAALGAELVVAAPEKAAQGLRQETTGARIGWVPLDVLAPTCDVIVHHGGGVTALTAANAGVPQVIVPKAANFAAAAHRLADRGGAVVLGEDEDAPRTIAKAAGHIVGEPAYRAAARNLADEIAGMPLPSTVVAALEQLCRQP